MKRIDPVHPEELIDAVRRDRRVERVVITRTQEWSWLRPRNGDGQEFDQTADVRIQANTTEHGAGGRGIPAGSELYHVARVSFDDAGLIDGCELLHGQPYGLVRLVADALGAHE